MPRELTWFDRARVPDGAEVPDDGRRILRVAVDGEADGALDWLRPKEPPPPPARQEVDLDAFLAARKGAATRPSATSRSLNEPAGPVDPRWPPSRQVLEALVLRGLTNREIAEMYGVARDTVAWHLHRLGIRRPTTLRQAMQSKGGRKGAARRAAVDAEPEAMEAPAAPAPEIDPDRAIEIFGRALVRALQQARAMGMEIDVRVRIGGGETA